MSGSLPKGSDSSLLNAPQTRPGFPPALSDGWAPTVTVDRRGVLLQVFNERYLPLHHATGPRTRQWANLMGLRYHPHLIIQPKQHIHYIRWQRVLAELQAGNDVWYLDVDVVPQRPLVIHQHENLPSIFTFSADGKGLCCGAFHVSSLGKYHVESILKELSPALNQIHLLEQHTVDRWLQRHNSSEALGLGSLKRLFSQFVIANPCSPEKDRSYAPLFHQWANADPAAALELINQRIEKTQHLWK